MLGWWIVTATEAAAERCFARSRRASHAAGSPASSRRRSCVRRGRCALRDGRATSVEAVEIRCSPPPARASWMASTARSRDPMTARVISARAWPSSAATASCSRTNAATTVTASTATAVEAIAPRTRPVGTPRRTFTWASSAIAARIHWRSRRAARGRTRRTAGCAERIAVCIAGMARCVGSRPATALHRLVSTAPTSATTSGTSGVRPCARSISARASASVGSRSVRRRTPASMPCGRSRRRRRSRSAPAA